MLISDYSSQLSKEGCQSDIPPPRRKRRTSEGIKSGRTTAKTSAISHEAGPPRGAMAGIDPSAEHELSPGHPEADSDADTRETPSSSAPGVGPKAGMKGGESFSQASMPNTSFPDTLHPGQGVGSPRESIGRQWDNQQKQGDLKVNVDQDTSWQRNPPDSIMQRQQMGMMGDGQEEGNQMMDFDQGSMMTQQRVNGRGEIGGVGPSYPMQVSSGGLSNSWNFDHQRGDPPPSSIWCFES